MLISDRIEVRLEAIAINLRAPAKASSTAVAATSARRLSGINSPTAMPFRVTTIDFPSVQTPHDLATLVSSSR
jgi:hypothetical protein